MSQLIRITYCSRSNLAGSRAEVEVQLRRILAAARHNNREARLTGALTFNENCFAQVIEGPAKELERIFQRIRRDPRHCDVTVLERRETGSRSFPTWSMAYVAAPDSDGRHPLAHFSFEPALTQGAGFEAAKLLDHLRRLVSESDEPVE
jgi:hypothetical protein